jgi:hypothetical protein
MTIKRLFEKNKQTTVVSKYLKSTDTNSPGPGIESAGHLSESIRKNYTFIPPVDYSNPENFAKFGSAEKYYKDSFDYIKGYYPYDGSSYEKLKFYNDLNLFEKYIYDKQYPKSTGYVTLGVNSAAETVSTGINGYAISSNPEYINVKGGPHKTTTYSVSQDRTNNLEFGGPSGSTVEFFFKKDTITNTSISSDRQVVMDLWNGITASSDSYGRFQIYISASNGGAQDRFYVTLQSGSSVPAYFSTPVPTTGGLDLSSGSWHHYAFALDTSLKQPELDFYVDGTCFERGITAAAEVGLVTGSLQANLGALVTSSTTYAAVDQFGAPSDQVGQGKLSASLDDFRFWKKTRTAEDIGRYWFSHVDGGTNKYDANVALGLYYKFNEGITGTGSVDKVVLDYSGRISNGLFTGYSKTLTRNTASAIDLMSLTSKREVKDPAVRQTTQYVYNKESLVSLGNYYDLNNSAGLINTFPRWIREEDEENSNELGELVQVVSNYFDVLHAQIGALSKIRNNSYPSGSETGSLNEFPYNDRLLETLGTEAPELFENIGTLAQYAQRDEQINFDQALFSIKNSIYKNIYNNLVYIYKSKGTEKAIRNFIRCFGVGENIIAVNIYPNNEDYILRSNYLDGVSTKKYIDASGLRHKQDAYGTIYQYYDSRNPGSSFGLISGSSPTGSHETTFDEFSFTLEAEVVFPDKSNKDMLDYEVPSLVSSSLFGFHTPQFNSPTSTALQWATQYMDFGLKVQAVRSPSPYAEIVSPDSHVKDVYFAVYDRNDALLLTSSIFQGVYENEKWNLALSVKAPKYPFAQKVLGTTISDGSSSPSSSYALELCGYNYNTGLLRNSFSVKKSVSYISGSQYLNLAKRIYAGSERTDFTGSATAPTDVRISSVRYWTDYLPTGTIDLHAKETDSFGRLNPYRNAYGFQNKAPGVFIPEIETLALNWDFNNVTGSNASGKFWVDDFSSGSNSTQYLNNYQGDDFSSLNLRQHTGRADFFEASSEPAIKQYTYSQKLQVPEYAASSDMVNIVVSDDERFNRSMRPISYFYAVEKSLYRSLSERMLQLFASMEEMNNLIGEPVYKYRQDYKSLEKMREIFFRNSDTNIIDFEKYVKFYKWIDTSMSELVEQLFPASARFAKNIRTVVENHILERPKVKYGYPGNFKRDVPSPVATITNTDSLCPDIPGWKYSHAPLPTPAGVQDEAENCWWWRTRANRSNVNISSSMWGVNADRTSILSAVQSLHTSSNVYCFSGEFSTPIVGGINQYLNKIRNVKDVVYTEFTFDQEVCDDALKPPELQKKWVSFKASDGYQSYKGQRLSPFTALSSSQATAGIVDDYREVLVSHGITNVALTNMHEDSIHPVEYSIPMQGPFTQQHVGGIQARHVNPMRKFISTYPRKESHTLTLATSLPPQISLNRITTGIIPKGNYLRGLASKSPVNISNIRTFTGSIEAWEGALPIGNFTENYEVIEGGDRTLANVDFIYNTADYSLDSSALPTTGSAMPTVFVTPPSSRTLLSTSPSGSGIYGAFVYASPRQKANRRITKSIIANQFAAPGSRQDSSQQARDIPSDQYSPNNALPYRNEAVRRIGNLTNRMLGQSLGGGAGIHGYLKIYTGWGGFQQNLVDSVIASSTAEFNYATSLYGADALAHFNAGKGSPVVVLPISQPNIINASHGNGFYRFSAKMPPGGGSPGGGGLAALHKTQRNTTLRREIFYEAGSPPADPWVYMTGSVRDNGFVTRPIPAADNMLWVWGMSGSDNPSYQTYLLSGTQLPANMTTYTSSLGISPYLGTSALTGTAGSVRYLWARQPFYSPFSQLRSGEIKPARNLNKNLMYRLPLNFRRLRPDENPDNGGIVISTGGKSSTYINRTGISITNRFSNAYKETPITSRYKPLKTFIKTSPGSAARTEYEHQDQVNTTVKYSYGNVLMGFANRPLNQHYRHWKWYQGKIKRPYEIIRDNYVQSVAPQVDGVNIVQLNSYAETIYPKEIYTYFSESRARQNFKIGFWKDDININVTSAKASMAAFTVVTDLSSEANQRQASRNANRWKSAFETSQGYTLKNVDQQPYTSVPPTGDGTGSIWPLDSWIFSEFNDQDGLYLTEDLAGAAAALPCGELLLTHYGTAYNAGTTLVSPQYVTKANTVSSQYVYNVPSRLINAGKGYDFSPAILAPGGPLTRPSWSAARSRIGIYGDTLSKQYPFYNSYEDFHKDTRLAGQEYSIVPEFRVSEHYPTYLTNINPLNRVTTTLSLTGANHDNYNSSFDNFYERYVYTDYVENLEDFMAEGGIDLLFNKYPKHFELSSDALIKFLPYDGFYPQDRSLQISTLFSSSYSGAATYSGASGSSPMRWRTLLRPFFAPGILYNSIKSGMSVDYPVLRDGIQSQTIYPIQATQPLSGLKSGSYSSAVPAANIPGNTRRPSPTDNDGGWNFADNLTGSDLATFWWSQRFPFEAILNPDEYLKRTDNADIILSDINMYLYNDVTGSVKEGGNDTLYRNAISNFLGATPKFFLKKKKTANAEPGFMTKFVSKFGNPKNFTGVGSELQGGVNVVQVRENIAYMMEVGLQKTQNMNLYNNPYAFGVPTATGSTATTWTGYNIATDDLASTGERPKEAKWPHHRAEFAPFTPPYYYGPSLARFTYIPQAGVSEVTLEEILDQSYVEFINESGSYYDFSSGSFWCPDAGAYVSTTGTPKYEWNRAWQNRMDIDRSIVINNVFPTDNGAYQTLDPNKWVIMPKWECPILDHRNTSATATGEWNFSSSVAVGEYNSQTYGMWHSSGRKPKDGEGIYMFLRDISKKDLDYRLIGDPSQVTPSACTGRYRYCSKVPKYVYEKLGDSPRIESLASLVGFDESEIMRGGWDPRRAKKLGELQDEGPDQKIFSEGIVAIPFYRDEDNIVRVMTLRGDYATLGPKVKEFRRSFTKYSFPPGIMSRLKPMVPTGYPDIPEVINPFGPDTFDVLENAPEPGSRYAVPVVYLMEHTVAFSEQDLADIWQGIMPNSSTRVQKSLVGIDHYMPAEETEGVGANVFPEVLKAQELLGVPQNGVPRHDLLDTVFSGNGFTPEIRWMVFKVKERGIRSYTQLIQEEVEGIENLTFDSLVRQASSRLGVEAEQLENYRRTWEETKYHLDHAPGYNWPYDYCSLVEMAKINTKVGFRPDLERELADQRRPLPELPGEGFIFSPPPSTPSLDNIGFQFRPTG